MTVGRKEPGRCGADTAIRAQAGLRELPLPDIAGKGPVIVGRGFSPRQWPVVKAPARGQAAGFAPVRRWHLS